MLDFCKPDDQWRVHRLQGEFAAMEVQLKELREELCGEQQTNHQMTFCEAKLAEKLLGLDSDSVLFFNDAFVE